MAIFSRFIIGVLSVGALLAEASSKKIPMSSPKENKFPTEKDLRSEFELKSDEVYEASLKDTVSWLTTPRGSDERILIDKVCEEKYGAEKSVLAPGEKTLSCVPWQLEKLAFQRFEEKPPRKPSKPSVGYKIVRSEADWNLLADANFYDAHRYIRISSISEAKTVTEYGLKYAKDCRFGETNAALLARIEPFLPAPEAQKLMVDVYHSSESCLNPELDSFERTHQRIGFLYLSQGEWKKAKEALLYALKAEDSNEESRTLFWLGVIYQNEMISETSPQVGQNPYWAYLSKTHPLTIHAILAAHSEKIDPINTLSDEASIKVARRKNEKEWGENDSALLIAELLIARKETAALKSWMSYMFREIDPRSPESALYMAKIYNHAEAYRPSIAMLSRYFRMKPHENLSGAVLELLYPRPYAEEIVAHAVDVDPVLVFALIRQESAFDPQAQSVANARGLMQLLPSTARRLDKIQAGDLFNPEINLRLGVQYMTKLLQRYDGQVEHVLAAYNAGASNIERWKQRYPDIPILLFSDLIPFKETRDYVSIILRNAYWYSRLMGRQGDKVAQDILSRSAKATWRAETVTDLLRPPEMVAENKKPADAVAPDRFDIISEISGSFQFRRDEVTRLGPFMLSVDEMER